MSLSDRLAIWSLVVSVFGTLVTLGGFIVAIWQLRKSTSATQAAAKAMTDAAFRMRENHLLVLLPQLYAVEMDLDFAQEQDDRRSARRALVTYSQTASQVAELLASLEHADSEFIALLRDSAESASRVKGKLSANKRLSVRAAIAPVLEDISAVATKASGLAAQYQVKVV